MRCILLTLAVIAAALLLLAADIFLAGDDGLFISPPEAVAEGFTRNMVSGRYNRALPYLGEDLGARLDADSLRRMAAEIPREEVRDVKGEPGAVAGDSATADATLRMKDGGERRIHFRFAREEGEWAIEEIATWN